MPAAFINGINMYYEEQGSGEPVVLITGLEDNATVWDNQVPALKGRYRVVRFDNRGAGRTDAPIGPYSIRQMADDTAGLMDHLGIGRAHVVGHSMGGMIAQELALTYSDRVAKLVPLASLSRLPGTFATWLEFGKLGYRLGLDPRAFALYGMPWVFSPSLLQDPDKAMAMLDEIMANPYPITAQGFAGQAAAVEVFNAFDRLHQIKSPTLALVGADDILTPPCCSEEIAHHVRGGRLQVLPRGGHGVILEYPKESNEALLAFLGEGF